MQLLGAQDPKALQIIRKLKKIGMESEDNALIGYAYYRYAYYYYFTVQDLHKFRKYVQIAIRYLLRSDDKEFLGGAYNLVAYDAQDLGCYDVAYAFFMIAVQASEQKEGIGLPGLIEASAGRTLIELGDYKKGRRQQKNAIKRMQEYTDMHVYHYNMILTYADIALASFLLGDARGVADARKHAEEHLRVASREEANLSKTYYLLIGIYTALMENDDEQLEENVDVLLKHWKKMDWSELIGLMFEIESVCGYMLEHDYIRQVVQILDATTVIRKAENPNMVVRYYTLKVAYNEKIHDLVELRECLRMQHEMQKKREAEASRMIRYAMEFSDMIEAIAEERRKAEEENIALQIRANTDALTGLPNRNAMNRRLQEQFDKAKQEKTMFGIGILDVDDFKQYNDTYGHRAGDSCLQKIGKTLQQFNAQQDLFCARYGGDEFVIGFFGLSNKEIDVRARAIEEQIARGSVGKRRVPIRVSIGVCNGIPAGDKKLWDYLTIADRKLYKIKKSKSVS